MLKSKKRFIYMILVGIAVAFLLKISVYTDVNNHPPIYDFIIAMLISIVVWEGNLWIDDWMNTHYPWVSKTKQRILFHLPLAMIYTCLSLYFLMLIYNTYICGLDTQLRTLMRTSILISLIISMLLLSFEIGGQLLNGWKKSLLDVERYKTESVQAQLKNLKDQVNPHFLFNNLSVLSSLVYKDQEKAVDFINQLAKVYRYLLDNRSNELVRLSEEFDFMDAYIYLLKIRFDQNIHFHIQVNDESKHHFIPPMSLQMLVENAIKHNEISSALPLHVYIMATHDYLVVKNNLQHRINQEPSLKTGLKNIADRYKYFTDKEIIIEESKDNFTVQIPLIVNK